MQRTSYARMACPIARSLERVGEWWSMLILRDAFSGTTRFDDFRAGLGISTNMLARRLDALVDSGFLVRRRYCEKPPRDEYLLTDVGRDFRPVLLALFAFGDRHFPAGARRPRMVHAETGEPVEPVLVDRRSGLALDASSVRVVRSAPVAAGARSA